MKCGPSHEELQKRGLTNLSTYKKNLEEAAAASSTGREMEFLVAVRRRVAEWVIVLMAWICAIVMPFVLAVSPRSADSLKVGLLGLAFLAFSGYLGIKARAHGAHRGYFLKFTLPLILLGISTIIAVGSALKKLPS